jgi:hypothetical protein
MCVIKMECGHNISFFVDKIELCKCVRYCTGTKVTAATFETQIKPV